MEKFVKVNGRLIWTTHSGSGVPLILANGGPGSCDYLAPIAKMVNDITHVIRFEQSGCGRSDPASSYTVQGCLNELETIRQAYGVEKWLVGGHSWGADLALAYALHFPQRTLGVICMAGGRLNNDREWHKAYRAGRDAGLEQMPHFDYPANMTVNAQVNADWKQFIQSPTLLKEIAQLSMPALFIYGENDIRPSWPVQQVACLMGDGRFHHIPNASHYIWLTHATTLKHQLRQFIISILRDT